MKGYLTSYVGMFEAQADRMLDVGSIEIPLIQRDYAQGREDPQIREIRISFLEILLDAIAGGEPVGLDFVYGRIEGATFYPLDGQQRLTTLFLLHWYLASAANCLSADAAWTRLSYATRPSARLFCQRLATNPLPQDENAPSEWIKDQPWYLYVWQSDPSIQSMLVMIDDIHRQIQRYQRFDAQAAWERLTRNDSPAVSFYLLPLDDMESDEGLYIKMNSRGKPLTPFENFKARFEQDIQHSERADEFVHKIDGAWSDLLWPYHGHDNIVDNEFVAYIRFITELCELRDGRVVVSDRLGPRARAVFGEKNERASEHLDFLFGAFDHWQNAEHIDETFSDALSTALPGQADYDWQKVIFFGATSTNLFVQCLRQGQYLAMPQRLMLYAFLLHLIEGTTDFPRRLRMLRNLIVASEAEIRRDNMPSLIRDVWEIIVNGDIGAVARFRRNQVEDERRKLEFLDASPQLADALFRLEDHPILRGNLSAFELGSDTFRHRAEAFEAAFRDKQQWSGLTGALLTFGDYQRRRPNSRAWQFGTGSSGHETVWRDFLTNATHASLAPTRTVLGDLLDGLAGASGSVGEYFESVMDAWLSERESSGAFDWRYYLVKYPSMRSGETGIYYGADGRLGYCMCMLRTTQLNGYYRDPILLGVWQSSGAAERVQNPWFRGYETSPRWLRLERSGAGMRCVSNGFALQAPEDEAHKSTFLDFCDSHEAVTTANENIVLRIPQHNLGNGLVDRQDRIIVGAGFLRDLIELGL